MSFIFRPCCAPKMPEVAVDLFFSRDPIPTIICIYIRWVVHTQLWLLFGSFNIPHGQPARTRTVYASVSPYPEFRCHLFHCISPPFSNEKKRRSEVGCSRLQCLGGGGNESVSFWGFFAGRRSRCTPSPSFSMLERYRVSLFLVATYIK